jgi:peroxiredoxin
MDAPDVVPDGSTDTAAVSATSGPANSGGGRVALFVVGAVLAVVLIIAGVVSLLGPKGQGTPRNELVGTHIAAFNLPDASGGSVAAPWGAHHAAVLLFFAAYCAPCHRELPKLGPVVGTGTFGAIRVIGLDGDSSPSVATSFVAKEKLRFPVGFDSNLVVASELVPAGFPAAVFVRSNGTVAEVHYGALSAAQLRSGFALLR